jgi:hypothetical protein
MILACFNNYLGVILNTKLGIVGIVNNSEYSKPTNPLKKKENAGNHQHQFVRWIR